MLAALKDTILNPKNPGEVIFEIFESGCNSTKSIYVMIHQVGHVDDRPKIITFAGMTIDGPCSGFYRYIAQEGEISIVAK